MEQTGSKIGIFYHVKSDKDQTIEFLFNFLWHARREFFVPKLQYFLSFKYI